MKRTMLMAAAVLSAPVLMLTAAAGMRGAAAGPAAGRSGFAGASALVHGDTSIPDAELLKKYGHKVPEAILLDKFARDLGGTPFNHQKHLERKAARCGNCHHKDPQHIKPCWSCHNDKPKGEKIPGYLKAYHGLCVECHRAFKAEKGLGGGDPPPVQQCYGCHLRAG